MLLTGILISGGFQSYLVNQPEVFSHIQTKSSRQPVSRGKCAIYTIGKMFEADPWHPGWHMIGYWSSPGCASVFALPHSRIKEWQSSWHEEHDGGRLKQPTDLGDASQYKKLTFISEQRFNQILAVLLKRFGVVLYKTTWFLINLFFQGVDLLFLDW